MMHEMFFKVVFVFITYLSVPCEPTTVFDPVLKEYREVPTISTGQCTEVIKDTLTRFYDRTEYQAAEEGFRTRHDVQVLRIDTLILKY